MPNKIGIYDVDSKIPNLALMKISQYHKNIGDSVEMYNPLWIDSYDKIYASTIFNFSDKSNLIPDKMVIGGTGYDTHKTLPQDIEDCDPDYTIYNYPHSIGFTMRGCRFVCKFCVVPEKEGRPKSNNTIEEIWTNRKSNFVVLLDNDFFGNPLWEERIDEIKFYNLKVNFGKTKMIHFAWDRINDEKQIDKGIKICLDAGIKPKQMAFYVLIGFDSTPEQDMYRVEKLRAYGCNPYVMPYDKKDSYQKRFARWVNHKAVFKSVAWSDYR